MKIGDMEFSIKDPNLNARVQVEELSNIGGIKEFLFSFNYEEAIKVQPISITFSISSTANAALSAAAQKTSPYTPSP